MINQAGVKIMHQHHSRPQKISIRRIDWLLDYVCVTPVTGPSPGSPVLFLFARFRSRCEQRSKGEQLFVKK
ncbi:hypothetical protein AMELA_G00187630 [Ameiurus melas]|uniref:Uncharacterized protein n=1 Tax=Ameiurus melas TaxID=219545 RepID=A0A7J6A817_AMEME|nr:hypothetical protein AMELA_G00187630 [Ameiurus melas]